MSDPVVLTDLSGNVLHRNSAASQLFEADDGISLGENRLRFGNSSAEQFHLPAFQVSGNGDPDAEGHSFIVPRPSGKRPYLVAVRPLPVSDSVLGNSLPGDRIAAAIVVIRDPEAFSGVDPDLLRQSYDLSPAEIDLAVALDGGATIRDVAGRRGVAITTVRTQLYALMGKMYVNRQIDLIRLLQQYRSPF